ncbi:ABC transporter substrate-binding protein [Epibacterium sp. Ofav1-8]|uniref:ABC transporter substrate-binding protein n=1 Tax=Epibacterium sp. Ofav1-8 TaxID=2917735 RepID=UPI001EF52B7E|nr:ABC transporter substrate-binding protein [Epibacterium sp. Ofav1-8]MCG7626078.1 ABC transporter substrate-binding protein [Epibacterium sp. Ofav1-8]
MRSTILSGVMALCAAGTAWADDAPLVAFTAIVEHPALDATRDCAIEELARQGFVKGETLRTEYESAQGLVVNAAQIANRFVGMKPAVIVAASTPSSQSVLAATEEIPIVFSAVTDPVAAGLVADPANPGANITGVTDLSPVDRHFELAMQVVPDLKKLGVVYNPGEASSVALIDVIRAEAEKTGLELVEAAAVRTADLGAAVERMVGQVDAIYVMTDNTVASGLEALTAVANENGIPTIGGEASYAERGVMVAQGFSYCDIGTLTGEMVARILNGENPGDIPVGRSPLVEYGVNLGSASDVGITLPEDIVAQARFRGE